MFNKPQKDDPQQRFDREPAKQTDEPWKGIPEKDQFDLTRKKPDIEKWNETRVRTH